MEIVGIGSDIVECLRIGRMIERHGEMFLTRVFTLGASTTNFLNSLDYRHAPVLLN